MKFELNSLIIPRVNLDHLTDPFSITEIDNVVKEMPADRATGPDGFSGIFLKACRPIIKQEFYSLCDQFHEGKLNLQSINDGLVTLIPKVTSPSMITDLLRYLTVV